MALISIIVTPAGTTDLIFIPNYWNPDTLFGFVPGIESFILAFALAGVASSLYKFIFNLHQVNSKKKPLSAAWYPVALFSVITIATLFLSITGSILIYLWFILSQITAIYFYILRKDLGKHILFGGVTFAIFYISFFLILDRTVFLNFIEDNWVLKNLSGIMFLTIPFEEVIYAFSLGFVVTCFYEVLKGLSLKK